MRRYFSGGPWAGTWREMPDMSIGNVWRVPLPRAAPVWGPEPDVTQVEVDEGSYRLVKTSIHVSNGEFGSLPCMFWQGEKRYHWTTHLPPGDQLDAEVARQLRHVVPMLWALAGAPRVNCERDCEWWFPPGFLSHSTVIHGIHVEYKKEVAYPVLVCHTVPSGWRADV